MSAALWRSCLWGEVGKGKSEVREGEKETERSQREGSGGIRVVGSGGL